MKIGIVTYFNIKNYGSVLQAYSLRKVLGKRGHNPVFLHVREESLITRFLHKAHVGCVTLLKLIFSHSARKTHREIRRLRKDSAAGFSDETKQMFEEFIEQNLPSIRIGRGHLKRRAHTEEFGAFICGSNQIWSPLSLHLSGYKYLNFAPVSKRIAYAPSFGVAKVPPYNRAFVARKLRGINEISVRELAGAQIIKELTDKTVPVVIDPTMLLDGVDWRRLYEGMAKPREMDNYALCYFLDGPEVEEAERIMEYTHKHNLNTVVLSRKNTELLTRGAECVDAGPWEFLSYVDHATCIFTNSFHGCVFALLFGKPVVVFGRAHSETVKQTSRIETLLQMVGLTGCWYDPVKRDFSMEDSTGAAEKLVTYREQSMEFLEGVLNRRQGL